jgi:putative ABC transport system permease protein
MRGWLSGALHQSLRQFRTNPLRTILTLLGMVFGVGAVVSMVSIGEGAQRQILAMIDAMGADLTHIKAQPIAADRVGNTINDSVGLHRSDVMAIRNILTQEGPIAFRGAHDLGSSSFEIPASTIRTMLVSRDYFKVHKLIVAQGRPLLRMDHEEFRRVAVLGSRLAQEAFPEGAIGKRIRLEYAFFEVVGVLEPKAAKGGGGLPVSPAAYNRAVLIPFDTAIEELEPARAYSELELISIRSKSTEDTLSVKQLLVPAMLSLHGKIPDFEIIAPEEIRQQKASAQSVLNIALTSIAAISLLVGGIGVMNIMLANILERRNEIGLRRAVGARRRDIRNQFLTEAVVICCIGGVLGILIGLGISFTVGYLVELDVAFAWLSMVLAFGISLLVGIIFGLMPAMRAANVNPIEALQSE